MRAKLTQSKHLLAYILAVALTAAVIWACVAPLHLAPERTALYTLVILTDVSLLAVIAIYGLLTPWYRSRTGIGFMSTKVSFFTIITLTIINTLWFKVPVWASLAAWIFVILTINFGITWNIIYKQFIEHRSDEMSSSTTTNHTHGVHDVGHHHEGADRD